MSVCVMWGDGYGFCCMFYDFKKKCYQEISWICLFICMEVLISEMIMIIGVLFDNIKIGIIFFSFNGYFNYKLWEVLEINLVRLGDEGQCDVVIDFVNIFDDQKVMIWGGMDFWNVIQ